MSASTEKAPSLLLSVLNCKCPRCRRGDMFREKNAYKLKSTMKMREECAICDQPFDIEVGFYYGSSFVSYTITVALSVATLIAWWVLIGISLDDNRFFIWMIANAVILIGLQPVIMRVSRSIWLAFFVRYNPNWSTVPPKKPERQNETHKNNW